MSLLTLLFRLPLLPVQSLVKLGAVIKDEAERQRANFSLLRTLSMKPTPYASFGVQDGILPRYSRLNS